MLGQDVVADEKGVGDHHVAAGHHGVVPALQRAVGAVGAVIGCDQGRSGAAGCGQGAESRGAGTDVDHADALAADDLAQAQGVQGQDDRILGLHRHAHEPCARRRQVAFKPATLGNDKGFTPGGGDRRGHVKGRLLHATAVEFWRDLKQGKALGQGGGRRWAGRFGHARDTRVKCGAGAGGCSGAAVSLPRPTLWRAGRPARWRRRPGRAGRGAGRGPCRAERRARRRGCWRRCPGRPQRGPGDRPGHG